MFVRDEAGPAGESPPRTPAGRRAGSRRARLYVAAMVLAGLLALAALALLAGLAATDAGLLDRPIERWMSRLSGRAVRFGALHARLLGRNPSVEIDDLRIANPPGFPAGELARIRRVSATLRPLRIWSGSIGISALHLEGVSLSLIRFGPNRNNWTLHARHQGGPAFAALAGVEDFQVADARLRFHDLARALDISGPFAVGSGARPFDFRGEGIYGGAPISVAMRGGPLHGAAVGPPYPFSGALIDGHTRVAVRGASIQPFDLSAYRLVAQASGPNLADIGYLFHLVTPNSAPYRLSAQIVSGSGIMRIGKIDIRAGASHVTGKIWSNHRDPRRDIRARLHAERLDRADINAMLMTVPSRADARDRSGAVPPGPPSRYIISAAPLGVSRLRATDLDFDIGVATLTGYPLRLQGVTTRIDLDHGLLDVPSFRATLAGGTLTGKGHVDSRAAVPTIGLEMRMAALQLGQFPGGTGKAGRIDGHVALSGTGPSLHAAAAAAQGSGWLRVAALSLPRAAGWMIGGDLLRAATSGLGGAKASAATVTAEHFIGRDGHFRSAVLRAQSADGAALGNASIDFGTETFCAYLVGQPSKRRLFQVATPFRIAGPWMQPNVSILAGRKARGLGLRGKLGVLLTPVAGLLPVSPKGPPPRGCP